jgi:hypothetical protein
MNWAVFQREGFCQGEGKLGKIEGWKIILRVVQSLSSTDVPNADGNLLTTPVQNLPSPGYHWAFCLHCKLSLDRDHAAAERIVGRGLASQDSVRKDKVGRLKANTSVDIPVTRALRRRTRTHSTVPSHKTRPVLLRRRTPSPSVTCTGGKRPEGGGNLVQVGQAAFAQPAPLSTLHRARWATLGYGFHHNAYGSQIVHRGEFGPRVVSYARLRLA